MNQRKRFVLICESGGAQFFIPDEIPPSISVETMLRAINFPYRGGITLAMDSSGSRG